MRDWTQAEPELNEVGARLVFVTAEHVDVVRAEVDEQQFGGTWVVVDAAQWQDWGVANPKRPELPWPGTVVIDPSGIVRSIDLFEPYQNRRAPRDTLDGIGVPQPAAPSPPKPPESVDFAGAVQVSFSSTDGGALVSIEVADGFHLYGRKERQAVPISIAIHGAKGKAKIPSGHKKQVGYGVSWVLEDAISVPIATRGNPPTLMGTLTYQTCFESLCAPPETVEWMVPR